MELNTDKEIVANLMELKIMNVMKFNKNKQFYTNKRNKKCLQQNNYKKLKNKEIYC